MLLRPLAIVMALNLLPFSIYRSPVEVAAGDLSAQPLYRAAQTTGRAEPDTDARRLKPGKSAKGKLAPGQARYYRVPLTTDEYIHVTVDQKAVNVSLALSSPDGRQLIEIDNRSWSGPETLHWVAEASGDYKLRVTAVGKEGPAARYKLKMEKPRAATAQDKSRFAAQKAFAENESAREQATVEDNLKAIEKYKEAARLWHSTGDRLEEATVLNALGKAYEAAGENQESFNLYNQALLLWRSLANAEGEAAALNGIGIAYFRLGETQKALEYFNQALAMRRAGGDRLGESGTLIGIGTVYNVMSDFKKAIDFYNQALEIARAIGAVKVQGSALNNIAVAYHKTGELQKALDTYNESLKLSRDANNRPLEAQALTNLGQIYKDLGQQQKAIELYNQSIEISRAYGPRTLEGETLNHLGVLFFEKRERDKALEYFKQALELRRGDREGETNTLNNIAVIYRDHLKDYGKALEYFNQILSLDRASHNRLREAQVLIGIGRTYDLMRDKQKALDTYQQSLALSRAVGDQMLEANTLARIAAHQRASNNLAEARKYIEDAISLIEAIRGRIDNQELRASYFATVQMYYEFYIQLLMQLHQRNPAAGLNAAALEAAERARARGLLELLTEAGANIRQGVDVALVGRESALRKSLSEKAEQRIKLADKPDGEKRAEVLAKEIEALTSEYAQVEARIRSSSPRYAALVQPQPLAASEIRQLLDADTVLLEYALGAGRSYLWVVTPGSIASYELPKRAEIEEAARKFYNSITAPNRQARSGEERGLRVVEASAQNQEVTDAASRLSQMLIAPAAKELGTKRLVIVADGALQYVPFAALPQPDTADGKAAPLVVRHEIVTLPSASTLAVLRNETAGRKPAPKTIAVLADPVFNMDDERVKAAGSKAQTDGQASGSSAERRTKAGAEKTITSLGVMDDRARIVRLPGTRLEAEKILSLVNEGDKRQALDFAASRTTVISLDLSQYRFIHFATHGFIDSQQPSLSGLILSRVTEQGDWQDGFLLTQDVYNLRLPADLVVLSACQTGLGREIKGEGLVGLTRGFMYAGSPRVLVSLWSVDDRATAELMVHLYNGMLKEGLRPAAALRAAQIKMWEQSRWQAPYYWAAFVLQGEWK